MVAYSIVHLKCIYVLILQYLLIYITLKYSSNNSSSLLTNSNCVVTFYPSTIVSVYKIYYTKQNIFETFTDSQFQTLNILPPKPDVTTLLLTDHSPKYLSYYTYGEVEDSLLQIMIL